jgi:hypothetical protein
VACVFFFPAHHEVALLVDELRDAVTDDRVIIHQQNPRAGILHLILFGLCHGNLNSSAPKAVPQTID